MATIGFIGVGNMGGPMARNLVKAGHKVFAFDLGAAAVQRVVDAGGVAAKTVADAVREADVVVTMLPAGKHVDEVYNGANGVLSAGKKGAICIDCSTIDVATARAVHAKAKAAGFGWIDAPVSGGTTGAEAGTLTLMVGGDNADVEKARPYLEKVGKTIIHCGGPGNGQAAKICNNMLLGISMIGVSEAFVLAEKFGLDAQMLFDVSSKSSGQCWSLTTYCPVPGMVPTSPANRDYTPGFSADMMLKDLRLANDAATVLGAQTPLGAEATRIYAKYSEAGNGGKDFSGIIKYLGKK
jgi:3-hydroxyisobutyrate dehydrogenase